MKYFLILMVLLLVASCSTYSGALVDKQGGLAICESKSFMAVGNWRAGAMQEDCVKQFKGQGYRELP